MKARNALAALALASFIGASIAWATIGSPTEVGVFGKVIAINGVYVGANGSTLAVGPSGTVSGNAATATALAANGANCSAGAYPKGVSAAGAAESCTAVSLTADVSGVAPVANGGTNLSAATDDQVMLGNGTTWQSKAIPDCPDTGGNHLNYTASTNTFSCGTS